MSKKSRHSVNSHNRAGFRGFIADRLPVGYTPAWETNIFVLYIVLALLPSLFYAGRYWQARAELFEDTGSFENARRVIKAGAVMPDFAGLLGGALTGFVTMAVVCIAVQAALHYSYHRRGALSCYTMRRLPDKWEYHRRCLALPAIEAVIILVAAIPTFFIHYYTYMLCTPKICLAPDQLSRCLSIFLSSI